MPILLAIALATQPAPPSDRNELIAWARRCSATTRQRAITASAGKLSFADLVHSYYFPMIAAAHSVGGVERQADFLMRPEDSILDAKTVDSTAAQCDLDSPRATGESVGSLPVDRVQRDVMCLGVTTVLAGIGIGFQSYKGDGGPAAHWKFERSRYQVRMARSKEAQATFKTSNAVERALGKAIAASLEIGRPDKVGALCEAVA